MHIVNVWKFDRVWSAHVVIPYSAVLQQWTRHRSFAFSVESSRAVDLNTKYSPMWRSQGDNRMFSQTPILGWRRFALDLLWEISKYNNLMYQKLFKLLGAHRQHYNLVIKPYSEVDMIVSGSPYAWNHFFHLRAKEDSGAQAEISDIAQRLNKRFSEVEEIPTKIGFIYGPYLNEPIDVNVVTQYGRDFPDQEKAIQLNQAITMTGRTSTGKTGVLASEDSARRFVKRAIDKEHASVFEHHWCPTRNKKTRSGPFVGVKTIRDLVGL